MDYCEKTAIRSFFMISDQKRSFHFHPAFSYVLDVHARMQVSIVLFLLSQFAVHTTINELNHSTVSEYLELLSDFCLDIIVILVFLL